MLAMLAASGIALALPEDADQPINIRANEGELDRVSRTGIYRGDVQVDQGTLRIKAETMTVVYKDQKVTRITFNGTPATYQQQLNADEEMVFANAKTIVYYTQNEKLELEGDAFLSQQGNELRGEQIDYDIVAGKVDAESAGEGPIRMVVQPDRAP
ncbi:MAG: lipopolysaccharide transport periplasmic protein LptA [Pseudomonadales bacterium]